MVWQFHPSSDTFVCRIPTLCVDFHLQQYSPGINFVKDQNVVAIPEEVSFFCEGQTILQGFHLPNVIPLLVMSDYHLLVKNKVVLELRRPQRPIVVHCTTSNQHESCFTTT